MHEACTAPLGAVRRWAAGVVVVALLLGIVAQNLPDSALRGRLLPPTAGAARAVGLDQGWGMFAPNPTPVSVELLARVTRADGTTGVVALPRYGRGPGAYRTYRWTTYGRRVAEVEDERQLEVVARWIAANQPGGTALRVDLVRRSAQTPDPGSDRTRQWQETTIHRWARDDWTTS